MSQFEIETAKLKKEINNLKSIKENLKNLNVRIDNVRNSSILKATNMAQIRIVLENVRTQINEEMNSTKQLQESLDDIDKLYELAEKAINDQDTADSKFSDFIKDLMDSAKEKTEELLKYFQGLIDEFCSFFGDPVNMATGNYISEVEEIHINGFYPIYWKRFYNNIGNEEGVLGTGWSHNHEICLTKKYNQWIRMGSQGIRTIFELNQGGTYISIMGKVETLEETDQEIIITNERGQEYYDKNGHIVRFESKKGNYIGYHYEEERLVLIDNNSKQFIKLFYDKNGKRVINIEASDGIHIQYTYKDGELVNANNNGQITTYEYNPDGTLLKIINPDGKALLINEFDNNKRVTAQIFPDGGKMHYEYADNTTIFHAQNGEKIIFEHDKTFRHVKTIYEDGCEYFTYNERNQKTSYTNKKGNTFYYTYDNKGNITSITDPCGNTTSMTYNSNDKLIRLKEANNATTLFSYDKVGNLTERVDAIGQKITYKDYIKGKPQTVMLPNGSIIKMEYDNSGNMISKIRDNQIFEYFEYNDANQMISYIDGLGNKTTYEYDKNGRITKQHTPIGTEKCYEYTNSNKVSLFVDYNGAKKSYKYNAINKVECITDFHGNITQFEYDKMWNVIKKIMPNGLEYSYEYDKKNRLIQIIIDGKINASFTYDVNGNRTSVTNALGETIQYEYDEMDRVTCIKNPCGESMYIVYNQMGQVQKKTDYNGYAVWYKYDLLGRKTEEEDSFGAKTFFEYDAMNHLILRKDQSGRVMKWTYYLNGLLKNVCYPNGKSIHYEYASNGVKTEEIHNTGLHLYYNYDALNRVTEVYDNYGNRKCYTYDAKNNITSLTDANGNKTTYVYRDDGKCVEINDPFGSKLKYAYDQMGNIAAVTQCGIGSVIGKDSSKWIEKTTHFYRDNNGLLIKRINAIGNEECYTYDKLNRITHIVDGEGRETSLFYSKNGDLTKLLYNNGQEIVMRYDSMHHLISMQDDNGKVIVDRDVRGLPVRIVDYNGNAISFEWGVYGERKEIVYPDMSTIRYEYNDALQLSGLVVNENTISYYYDEYGRLTEKKYPNDIVSKFFYDEQGRVTKLQFEKEEELIKECGFLYDSCGNKKVVNWSNPVNPQNAYAFSYTYDELNRIKAVYQNNALIRSYEYDGFGNRILLEENETKTQYWYNDSNQLIYEEANSSASGLYRKKYEYDKVGNLCKVMRGLDEFQLESKYLYDNQNHVTEAITANGDAYYTYSGLGHLIKKYVHGEKTEYLVDFTRKAQNYLAKRTADNTHKYIWDKVLTASIDENGLHSVLTDDLGSISCVFDENGKYKQDFSYNEYGAIQSCENPTYDFGFVGYLFDNGMGLYYAQERNYDVLTGRFNREDPLLKKARNVQNQNLYTYCFNKPMTLVDLDGCTPSVGSWLETASDWAGDAWDGVCDLYDNTVQTVNNGREYIQDTWDDFCDSAYNTYNSITDSVTEWGQQKLESAETLYKLYTDKEFHYNRNINNEVPTDVGDICDLGGDHSGKNGWTLLDDNDAIYHRITDGQQGLDAKNNKKYVYYDESTGTSSEAVICFPSDGRDPYLVTDPVNAGTYNYCDINNSKIGHALYDLFPYWIYGNQEYDSGAEYFAYRITGAGSFGKSWYNSFKKGTLKICLE